MSSAVAEMQRSPNPKKAFKQRALHGTGCANTARRASSEIALARRRAAWAKRGTSSPANPSSASASTQDWSSPTYWNPNETSSRPAAQTGAAHGPAGLLRGGSVLPQSSLTGTAAKQRSTGQVTDRFLSPPTTLHPTAVGKSVAIRAARKKLRARVRLLRRPSRGLNIGIQGVVWWRVTISMAV